MIVIPKQEKLDYIYSLGYEVVSTPDDPQYLSNRLKLRCPKGHIFNRPYKLLRHHRDCDECKKDNIRELLSKNGFNFVDYNEIYCFKGHKQPSHWKAYIDANKCVECQRETRWMPFIDKGFRIINNECNFGILECPNGHKVNKRAYKNKDIRCYECEKQEIKKILDDKWHGEYAFKDGKFSVKLICHKGHSKLLQFFEIYNGERISCMQCEKDERDKNLATFGFTKINKKEMMCEKGHIFARFYDDVINKRCIVCPICYPNKSSFEVEVSDFLRGLNVEFIQHYNTNWISELDFYIPHLNIAIECNGSYWHSLNGGKGKDYHANKTKLCKEKGIKLIHIWEVDWRSKSKIVQGILKAKLQRNRKIFARNCGVGFIDGREFVAKYHIQGEVNASVYVGIYDEKELLGVMAFNKSRFDKAFEWELSRLCYKDGITVVGGASRMLKHFMRVYDGSIVSYADNSWSDGGVYEALGFTKIRESPPTYFYVKGGMKYNRHSLMRREMVKKLKHFDVNLTEEENALKHGFLKIYDCGKTTYAMERSYK